jgi:hypothetical protein
VCGGLMLTGSWVFERERCNMVDELGGLERYLSSGMVH